jgi:hypothetical protein
MVINQHRGFKKDKRGNRWEAEGEAEVDGTWQGTAKLNVDGAFSRNGGAELAWHYETIKAQSSLQHVGMFKTA